MEAKSILIGSSVLLVFFCVPVRAQDLGSGPYQGLGICKGYYCNTLRALQRLKDCVVVVGNLHILLLEKTRREHFNNMTFPNLREVTGFVLVYRVRGLDSLGQLFPNLARIRGNDVLGNFGLIVHDMPNLVEIGLYSLVKIDRGGVVIWGSPMACYADTIDWKSIAPRSRHVLSSPAPPVHCKRTCNCANTTRNYCWNDKTCQRFISGPFAEVCDEQCLGCRGGPRNCSVCRHHTYLGRCLPTCPPDTLLLHENKYCVSLVECEQLGFWEWRGGCVGRCPVGYVATNRSCEPCEDCAQTCNDLVISTLSSIQAAESCVYINGSLTIHARTGEEAADEMARYLSRIQLVADYVAVYGSHTIYSLQFLSSLRRIQGRKLKNGRYSLVVHGMTNLTSLFLPNVTRNLIIEHGTLSMYDNPLLCMSHIIQVSQLFPIQPNKLDVPQGMNGYSGSCREVSIGLQVNVSNDSTATVNFVPLKNPRAHYTVLFAKVPPQIHTAQAPETCSQSEWSTLSVNTSDTIVTSNVTVHLLNLNPSSRYAVCVEIYNPLQRNLARSSVVYFYTPVGKPAPPFIRELVAISEHAVDIRWSDHEDYRSHILYHKLDVSLIEIESEVVAARNYCRHREEEQPEPSRHVAMARPPAGYSACSDACVRSKPPPDPGLPLDYGDAWLGFDTAIDCDEYELNANTTHAGYIRTKILHVTAPNLGYQIQGLAPYRDYRFRLRACTNESCSRSTQGVVRTLHAQAADNVTSLSVSLSANGGLTVQWKPPQIVNGAILAYFVQAMLEREKEELGYPVPRSWCVHSNSLSLQVPLRATGVYLVRVCAATLAVERACSDWQRASQTKGYEAHWWYTGIFMGFAIWLISLLSSRFWRKQRNFIDEMPLIDSTSMYRSVTDSPDITASDFTPMYLMTERNEFFD